MTTLRSWQSPIRLTDSLCLNSSFSFSVKDFTSNTQDRILLCSSQNNNWRPLFDEHNGVCWCTGKQKDVFVPCSAFVFRWRALSNLWHVKSVCNHGWQSFWGNSLPTPCFLTILLPACAFTQTREQASPWGLRCKWRNSKKVRWNVFFETLRTLFKMSVDMESIPGDTGPQAILTAFYCSSMHRSI